MSAMPDIQREADVLFLPLAFNSPLSEHLRTSSPGKMGEFLAAGRPILVHTPPDSFTTWYFRHYECGVVVDENDPRALVAALSQLVEDSTLGERISLRAWERAQADFETTKVRARFLGVLNGTISASDPAPED